MALEGATPPQALIRLARIQCLEEMQYQGISVRPRTLLWVLAYNWDKPAGLRELPKASDVVGEGAARAQGWGGASAIPSEKGL